MTVGAWIVFVVLYSAAVIGMGVWSRNLRIRRQLEHKNLEFWMAKPRASGVAARHLADLGLAHAGGGSASGWARSMPMVPPGSGFYKFAWFNPLHPHHRPGCPSTVRWPASACRRPSAVVSGPEPVTSPRYSPSAYSYHGQGRNLW